MLINFSWIKNVLNYKALFKYQLIGIWKYTAIHTPYKNHVCFTDIHILDSIIILKHMWIPHHQQRLLIASYWNG